MARRTSSRRGPVGKLSHPKAIWQIFSRPGIPLHACILKHVVAHPVQRRAAHLPDHLLVVHGEHAHAAVLGGRQLDSECRALPEGRLDRDVPQVLLHDRVSGGEPEAVAGHLRGEIRVEIPVYVPRGDARAVIPEGDAQVAPRPGSKCPRGRTVPPWIGISSPMRSRRLTGSS